MTSVTVVTPWLDHPELARDYWLAMRAVDATVLIIDNGSSPPLPNAVRCKANLGFAPACNLGLRLATTDAVLFLNNDVAMTAPNWIDGIRAGLEPGVLVGAHLRNDPHAAVDGIPLPYLDGWCLAGMRDELLELGGFDESFDEPSYYGDNDLCLRARAAGMTLREVPVGLRHLANVTAGHGEVVTSATRANYERYAARARELLGAAA